MKEKDIKLFNKARRFLNKKIVEYLSFYFDKQYDVFSLVNVKNSVVSIINNDFINKFPKHDKILRPSYVIHFDIDEAIINYSVQRFVNHTLNCAYLGTKTVEKKVYDLYHRNIMFGPPMFVARYGHSKEDIVCGNPDSEMETYFRESSPLAYAFMLAKDQNYL